MTRFGHKLNYVINTFVKRTLVVLAAGAGREGCFYIFLFISSILSSFSNASSAGRRLDVLKYCGFGRYNRAVVSNCRRRAR